MGYKSELQSNNADLRAILEEINALPEGAGGESGGGADSLDIPDAYKSYVEAAKAQYTGDYAHLAILEGENKLNVAFLMDDFTLLTYNEKTTEFTAVGWLYCEYTKDAQTWLVVDHTTEASAGSNYAKNIRYSSVYWEYNGQVIWPFGMSGGGGSGSKPGGAIIFARSADAVCGGDVRGVTTLTEEIT